MQWKRIRSLPPGVTFTLGGQILKQVIIMLSKNRDRLKVLREYLPLNSNWRVECIFY